jgi:1,4-dihydroxy-2-naphthoyl-CoA hydrolase
MSIEGDMLDLIPFARAIGISVVRLEPACVQVHLDWDHDLCTSGGVLHGGVIMAAADTAGGICAYCNLPPGAAGTITIESKTNFVNAVTRGDIRVTAKPIHVGRSLVVIQSDVRNDEELLVACVTQSQLVLSQ